jgi:hypothetical protein
MPDTAWGFCPKPYESVSIYFTKNAFPNGHSSGNGGRRREEVRS